MKILIQWMIGVLSFFAISSLYGADVSPQEQRVLIGSAIHTLDVQGPGSVEIILGGQNTQIQLPMSDARSLQKVVRVKKDRLYLRLNPALFHAHLMLPEVGVIYLKNLNMATVKAEYPVEIALKADRVTLLRLMGPMNISQLLASHRTHVVTSGKITIQQILNDSSGILTLHDITSQTMILNNRGTGNVFLQGSINELRVNQNGKETIDIDLSSNQVLEIQANASGSIRCTGHTRKLVAYLKDHAFLNATTLQADDVFISTSHHAIAKTSPVVRLFARAQDKSFIDYYQEPSQVFIAPESANKVFHLSRH